MKALRYIFIIIIISGQAFGQGVPLIEPPFWWTGMMEKEVQLMVHAKRIAFTAPHLVYPGVSIQKVSKTANPDYLFLDILIGDNAQPGSFRIDFDRDEALRYSYTYELKERADGSAQRTGFGRRDVIYLLMPDRFSNGDTANDNVPGMLEKANRNNPDGRHGGDLKGIARNLQYIAGMGFTAVWLNPVLENNNPHYSYHGYAITDFYTIDPRFGTNEEYRKFVEQAHGHGLKVIKDMVFNHCGGGHWWMDNLPSEDWIHQWPGFTRSNFRAPVNSDPHASSYDKIRMQKGWFDTNMPDLNQNNEFLANYLIQNSIWWVEYAGLDGIRMDTYPYSDQEFMQRWMQRMHREYPNFTVLGETWLQKEAITAWYAGSENNRFGYNSHLDSQTDFPLHYAIEKAFHEEESWTEGLARLYYVLAQDFLYDDPYVNVIFADNHDLTRYFTLMKEDINKYKMGLAYLLTTRGIPMVYYGTEILMEGEEQSGHGYIREDFPGGWPGDEVNAFTGDGLRFEQIGAQAFLQHLLQWRKGQAAIHEGRLVHFIPDDGIYVFFRLLDEHRIMVVLNNNGEEKQMPPVDRFDECLNGNRKAIEVIGGSDVEDLQTLMLPPKSTLILEINHY